MSHLTIPNYFEVFVGLPRNLETLAKSVQAPVKPSTLLCFSYVLLYHRGDKTFFILNNLVYDVKSTSYILEEVLV